MEAVTQDRLARRLLLAGYLFAFGSAVHVVDHLRRGQDSVTEQLYWAGNLALVVQVAVITLILTRHRLAPLAAAAASGASRCRVRISVITATCTIRARLPAQYSCSVTLSCPRRRWSTMWTALPTANR